MNLSLKLKFLLRLKLLTRVWGFISYNRLLSRGVPIVMLTSKSRNFPPRNSYSSVCCMNVEQTRR